jgi:hypothetical protein
LHRARLYLGQFSRPSSIFPSWHCLLQVAAEPGRKALRSTLAGGEVAMG